MMDQTPQPGDIVAFDRDLRTHTRVVKYVWVENAEGSAMRGPMVTVNYGGGSISIPVSDLI